MKLLYRMTMLLLLTSLIVTASGCTSDNSAAEQESRLVVYCGAGLKNIMTQIADDYEKASGTKIEFIFNGSGMLLNQIRTSSTGDLFIPGEASFIDQLEEETGENAVMGRETLFDNVPVIIIGKDMQNEVKTLEDLGNIPCRIGLGDSSIAIGKLMDKIMDKNGLREKIEPNVEVRFSTVNQIVSAVEMDQVDAGVVFYINYVDCDQEKVSMVDIPLEKNAIQKVDVCVLGTTEQEEEAMAFMDYIANEGRGIYEKYQYR